MKRFLLIIFIICFFSQLSAVPAFPYPVVFTQPNGEQVTLIMQGDEFVRFAQTLDGYTLLYNDEGYFCYAQKNEQGEIEPSGFYAEEISNRNMDVVNMLANTSKNLRFSSNQIAAYQQIREMIQHENNPNRGNTTGVRKLLTILMQYPDKPFIKTQEDFHNLFNQIKYTEYGANGSVKDFFNECSYNKLDLQTTVVGPFTAKNKHAYYGDMKHAQELAREAVIAAHDAGVNFSDFAINGKVPSFYMIFAGNGQEAGAGTDCIWSHAWIIDPSNPISFDGVEISNYACSPEHRGSGGKDITWIGVICHEFGHSLGAPDYYDTDYSTNGSYEGTGYWDLQASGSWNDNGRTPAPPNPRSKIYTYNWASVMELNSAQTVTIPTARIYDNAYFRINTQTPNEYYILENKIRGGYDDYIPGVDMLIYHCAANMNNMNTTSPQKFYPVAANAPVDLPAAGDNCQADYGTINSWACAWPGYTGKQEFTDNTIPAMISWNRQPTGKPITNITKHSDYITFDILGGGSKNEFIVFLPKYYGCTITPESGSFSPVPTGEDFTFSINISETHSQSIIVVKSNGNIITPVENKYTISDIQSDQMVTIEGLKYNTVNITANAGTNGQISPNGIVEVPIGNVQHFDIIPNLGFSVEDVLVDGVSIGPVKHYVFKNVDTTHTISARYKYGTKYSILLSTNFLQFSTPPGVTSNAQSVNINSPGLAGNILVKAPERFEISNNGTKWYKSFVIGKTQLPYTLFIRYCPDIEDREHALEKLSLCSVEAYNEIVLYGNLILPVNERKHQVFKVYPNPTTGELQITNDELRITSVEVFDVYGRKQNVEFRSYGLTLLRSYGLSHFPTGIYILAIHTPTGVFYEKIIKQ